MGVSEIVHDKKTTYIYICICKCIDKGIYRSLDVVCSCRDYFGIYVNVDNYIYLLIVLL